MPKAKPYSGPVDDKLAAQLLNSTGVTADNDEPLGDALIEARRRVEQLVAMANDALEGSEFAKIVAEHLANKMSRRGHALIGVSDDGHIELHISYEEQGSRRPRQQPKKLPLLEEIKAEAEAMGIDVSEFGMKRKKMWEHLHAIEAGEIKGTPLKKAPKPTAKPKAKPKPVVQVAEDAPPDDPGPMSAGPDETKVSPPPDDPPPPKKARVFVKNDEADVPVVVRAAESKSPPKPAEPKKGPKPAESHEQPDMRQLVKDSQELSIADLLQSDGPK